MHEAFQRAINPQSRFRVLGLRMQPLTLGHLFLLHEWGCPIVRGEPHQSGWLLLAAIICAHKTAASAARTFRWFSWASAPLCFVWGFLCRNLDLATHWKRFFAYLSEERSRPPTQTPADGQSRELGAPWEWVLFDFLRSTYRMSKREALAMPMREAGALWAVNGDSQGRLMLATAPGSTCSLIKGLWARAREGQQQRKENN